MAYLMQRFQVSLSGGEGTGLDVGDEINNFLAVNPDITIVDVTVNWIEGRTRANAAVINLIYSDCSGARQWAALFTGSPTNTVQQQTQSFFNSNPGFVPVLVVDLRPPTTTQTAKALVIYMSGRDLIRTARPGVYINYAPCGGDVASGDFGTFINVDDASAPPVTAQNIGSSNWPQGRPGILIRNVSGCAGDACEGCTLGGIARTCGASGAAPCTALTFEADCGCIGGSWEGEPPPAQPPWVPPPSTTTTPVTTTTSTSTSTYPTTTTTTTTTTSTTTSTTTTAPPGPAEFEVDVSIDWDGTATGDADLDIYLKDTTTLGDPVCFYGDTNPLISGGDMLLNTDAFPVCDPAPLPPEIITATVNNRNKIFEVWWAQFSNCALEVSSGDVTQAVTVTNTSTTRSIRARFNGGAWTTILPLNSALISSSIVSAGYNVGDASAFLGGDTIEVEAL